MLVWLGATVAAEVAIMERAVRGPLREPSPGLPDPAGRLTGARERGGPGLKAPLLALGGESEWRCGVGGRPFLSRVLRVPSESRPGMAGGACSLWGMKDTTCPMGLV